MRKFTTRDLTLSAAVAAVYFVLSYFASIFGLAYGPIQCRFAEALCVLPFLFPCTVPGLFIGCLLTNLLSGYGAVDIIFGSTATLIAALCTAKVPHKWLAPLPPVLANGIILGAMFSWYEVGFTSKFPALFAYNGATVAIGEVLACYVLGLLLINSLPKLRFFRELIPTDRLSRI